MIQNEMPKDWNEWDDKLIKKGKKYFPKLGEDDIRDLLQEAKIAMYEKLRKGDKEIDNHYAYLQKILHSKSCDLVKKKRVTEGDSIDGDIPDPDTIGSESKEKEIEIEGKLICITQFMSGEIPLLTKRQRFILQKYADGCKQAEIVKDLNKTFPGTKATRSSVSSEIFKIKTKIKDYYIKKIKQ